MTALDFSPDVDWGKFAPTRQKLWVAISAWAAIAVIGTLLTYMLVLTGRSDVTIGGDFVVFYASATEAIRGGAAQLYDRIAFETLLHTHHAVPNDVSLTWQYPPAYLLLILPLAAAPFYFAFPLWSTTTAVGFYATARLVTRDRLVLFALIAAPASYTAYVTGQNGFFTAALLSIAAMLPHKRPLLAGFAAGLLTVKPHLGLLIPIAYLAAGCWRAFAIAALTSLLLAAGSVAVFGLETWVAFFAAASQTAELLDNQSLPLAKMSTLFSALLFTGAPKILAYAVYAFGALSCAVFVFATWRRVSDPLLRMAALVASIFMVAPYGYHYELIILTIPGAIIVVRALKTGWLKYERPLIAVAYIAPAFIAETANAQQGLSLGFTVTAIIFGLTVRRVLHDAPDLFRVKPTAAPS
ncbi:MAG: glycosyltransferase family 87 protein [Pseudomonadota bacterium]